MLNKPPYNSLTCVCKSARQFRSWLGSSMHVHLPVRLKRTLLVLAGLSHVYGSICMFVWSSLIWDSCFVLHMVTYLSSSTLSRDYSLGCSKVYKRVETCKVSGCLDSQLAYHLFHLILLSGGTSPGQPRYKKWDIDSLWEKDQSHIVNGIDVGGINYKSFLQSVYHTI